MRGCYTFEVSIHSRARRDASNGERRGRLSGAGQNDDLELGVCIVASVSLRLFLGNTPRDCLPLSSREEYSGFLYPKTSWKMMWFYPMRGRLYTVALMVGGADDEGDVRDVPLFFMG